MLSTSASGINYDWPYGMTRDNSGQILIVGQRFNGLDYDMIIWRLNGNDGSLDATFDNDGQYIYTGAEIAGVEP